MIDCKVFADKAAASVWAASQICDMIRDNPTANLGVATGSSPADVYAEIARQVHADSIDVTRLRAFALDEYLGLDTRHPQSYHYFIDEHVTKQIGLAPQNVRVPFAEGHSTGDVIDDYDAEIADAGGIDLQILGIGSNGHIAFNEPGTPFDSVTHVEPLTQSTRADNRRFFDHTAEVPILSVTQGIGTIMNARRIILLAFGENKAEAVRDSVRGPATEDVPASVLQNHPNVVFALDEAAASLL